MAKAKKTITLLWGLPGSGKTHYGKEQSREDQTYYGTDTLRVDIDALMKGSYYEKPLKGKALVDAVAENVYSALATGYGSYNRKSVKEVILDGLVTTNEQARTLLTAIKETIGKAYDIQWKVVFWREDREACLWNDKGRRDVDSKITIQNAPLEKPSKEPSDFILAVSSH